MQIVLLGPPGSGKGTMAKGLAEFYKLPHISTGDVFRLNIRGKTELGRKAASYIENGDLVPDEVTIAMVKDCLGQASCQDGFILDGFPRTVPQAEALTDILSDYGKQLTIVLDIEVSKQSIIDRVSGRRHCSGCNRSYNIMYQPPAVDGLCDDCGGQLVQRNDDQPETVLKRLDTYERQTAPLIDFYTQRGLLVSIDNEGEIGSSMELVEAAIDRMAAKRN